MFVQEKKIIIISAPSYKQINSAEFLSCTVFKAPFQTRELQEKS